jgi:hypothetical protein
MAKQNWNDLVLGGPGRRLGGGGFGHGARKPLGGSGIDRDEDCNQGDREPPANLLAAPKD